MRFINFPSKLCGTGIECFLYSKTKIILKIKKSDRYLFLLFVIKNN